MADDTQQPPNEQPGAPPPPQERDLHAILEETAPPPGEDRAQWAEKRKTEREREHERAPLLEDEPPPERPSIRQQAPYPQPPSIDQTAVIGAAAAQRGDDLSRTPGGQPIAPPAGQNGELAELLRGILDELKGQSGLLSKIAEKTGIIAT
jgi:hypothetical protein